MRTRIYTGRRYLGQFTCDGRKVTKFQAFQIYFKIWLKRVAMGTVVAWLVVGGIKVGQTVAPRDTVYAKETVEVPVNEDIPILNKIIQCESGGKQFGKDGQVLLHVNTNGTVDYGIGQINSVWFKTATKMGYNLSLEADNKAFTRYLFMTYGSEPWYSSKKSCWSK